jgi:SpoIIAA-like
MITIDHRDQLVSIAALGEFTLTDFREFEELVLHKIKFAGPVSLLMDLREMIDFTVDMAWEEVKFSREHAGDFVRIAVVTNSQWVAWSAWLQQLFVSADLRVFEDVAEAQAWVEEA